MTTPDQPGQENTATHSGAHDFRSDFPEKELADLRLRSVGTRCP